MASCMPLPWLVSRIKFDVVKSMHTPTLAVKKNQEKTAMIKYMTAYCTGLLLLLSPPIAVFGGTTIHLFVFTIVAL
jgi:hypothetical protein